MKEIYLRTARMLTQVAPIVFTDDTFALKGGTAINLFYRDMPRLSVDLDLVFRDHAVPRADALAQIDAGIKAMAARLRARGFTMRAPITVDNETKLVVQRDDITVKVEVNTVMRGTVHPVRIAGLTAQASDVLKADLELPVASLENLLAARTRMIRELQAGLDAQERAFLLSLVAGDPQWELLGVAHASQLPGVRWKLHNLDQLKRTNPAKFAEQRARLHERFDDVDQRRG